MKRIVLLGLVGVMGIWGIMGEARAQRIRGFVSSGASLSQIEGDELKGFRMLGYVGGVGAIVNLDREGSWNISIEALFAQRGAYNNSGDPYSVSINLNYVDIPLMLHYRDPWGGMLVGLGLNYGRLVQQPHVYGAYQPNYFYPDTSNLQFLNNDLMVAADIRFPIWKGLWFNIRWMYSLIAIKKDWEFTELNANGSLKDHWSNDCYNNSLVFRLIWQF